jgi:hypothetical protein
MKMFSVYLYIHNKFEQMYCYVLNILGWEVTEDQLKEAAFHSGVLDVEDDYLEPDFRARCVAIIANPADVKPKDCVEAFLNLVVHFCI